MGMAFQIVDDILDFTGAAATLGKPAQADMELGLSTAPVLFASQEVDEIKPLIMRRFKEEGDIQKAVALSQETDCIAKSYHLAEFHAQRAVDNTQLSVNHAAVRAGNTDDVIALKR